jgi:uncharacterized lipoprotein YmbA
MLKILMTIVAVALTGCSVTLEETLMEGNNNKVIEESKQSDDADIKAKLKLPIV